MSDSVIHWQAIRLKVGPEAVEAIEFAFNSLDALGTETELIRRDAAEITVTGYFDLLPSAETIQDELHYALRSYGLGENAILSLERHTIEDSDWLAEWKRHWKPTTIGNFVVAAPWHEVDGAEKIVIRIEPNMAFGTGTHETTQLCLKAIDELYAPGDSFLDVGTGTGILAIAAALRSKNSKKAIDSTTAGRNPSDSEGVITRGFDTDVDSIKIARENADLNHVGRLITFFASPISVETAAADFICANLTLDVIMPILPLLLSKARRHLVLSGILETQKGAITTELNDLEIRDVQIETTGEWISVVIKPGN